MDKSPKGYYNAKQLIFYIGMSKSKQVKLTRQQKVWPLAAQSKHK